MSSLMVSAILAANDREPSARRECGAEDRPHTRLSFDWNGAGYHLSACRQHEAGADWQHIAPLDVSRSSATVVHTRGASGAVVSLRRNEYGEFVVRCYIDNGRRYPEGDYFTNDKEDAIATARHMVSTRIHQHFNITE